MVTVIWSGTWEFSTEEIAAVSDLYRDQLTLLASEKDREGYERVAAHVDGDAYYWSSVDPETTPGYAEKLADMSAAVHEHDGVWIAPAARGFDALGVLADVLVGEPVAFPRTPAASDGGSADTPLPSAMVVLGLVAGTIVLALGVISRRGRADRRPSSLATPRVPPRGVAGRKQS